MKEEILPEWTCESRVAIAMIQMALGAGFAGVGNRALTGVSGIDRRYAIGKPALMPKFTDLAKTSHLPNEIFQRRTFHSP